MEDEVNDNEDLRQLLKGAGDVSSDQRRTRLALSRARRQVGQRDTLAFAFVKIWAVLARLVAPLFATFGEKQAAILRQPLPKTSENEKTIN